MGDPHEIESRGGRVRGEPQSRVTYWMLEIIEYRGYRLQVGPVGKGWRVSIYSPDSTSALPDSPTNLEKSRKDDIVAEAKRIIDERFASRS